MPPRPPGSSLPRPSRPSASSSAFCRAARLRTICSARRRRFSTRRMRRLIATAQSSPIVSGSHLLVGAHHPPQALRVEPAVRVGDVRPGQTQDPRVALEVALGELGELAVVVGGRSSRISRSCSSTMWKLSTSHSAAGVIDRSSLIARARMRYDSSRTRPFSATRGRTACPRRGVSVTAWAAASVWACCSSRSTLKSSARIGSSGSACWRDPDGDHDRAGLRGARFDVIFGCQGMA